MGTDSKVIVVTGASSGLGRQVAIDLAASGAKVIVVGRDATRTNETAAEIKARGGKAEVALGDVSTRDGVKQVAKQILEKSKRIDVLLNNAGGNFKGKQLNADGVEQTFALNTLGAFLLERELHGALARPGGRVVNVVTGMLDQFPLQVDELVSPSKFSTLKQYGRSKLAGVMMTVEQAKRFEAEGLKVVSVHPGIIMGTRFGGGQPKLAQLLAGPVMRAIGIGATVEEASRRFQVACFDDVPNGAYIVKGKPDRLPKQANDEKVRAAVYALLEGLAKPRAAAA